MPTYGYSCQKCKKSIEDDASINSFRDHHPPCPKPKCGGTCDYKWVPSVPQIVFKDGPTGSWPSKGERFKKFRQKSSAAAEKRQNERFGGISREAVPNYKGTETGTWRDAQDMAKRDAGPAVAATYKSKVSKEAKKLSKKK